MNGIIGESIEYIREKIHDIITRKRFMKHEGRYQNKK